MGELTLLTLSTPPSYNQFGYTGGPNSRWKTTKVVKAWKLDFFMLLGANRMPKNVGRVEVTATMRFKTKRVRDEGNFRVVIEKALGDALVLHGAIVDDDHEHYSFGRLTILHDPMVHSTEIVLRWQDTETTTSE